MQRIAISAIAIMAAALCVAVTASGARGGSIVLRRGEGIARRRVDHRGFAQLIDTYALSNFCREDVGKLLLNNKSVTAFMASSPSVRIMSKGMGKNQEQYHRRHQECNIFQQQQQQHRHRSSSTQVNDADTGEFYANPISYPDFSSLGITSPALLRRLTSPPLGLKRPSAVQAAVFETISRGNNDVIVGAETGE